MTITLHIHRTSTIKRCLSPDEHSPFHYWRREEQAKVCDLCNFSTAWKGKQGQLWQYPEEVQEALREALASQYPEPQQNELEETYV